MIMLNLIDNCVTHGNNERAGHRLTFPTFGDKASVSSTAVTICIACVQKYYSTCFHNHLPFLNYLDQNFYYCMRK